MKKYYYTIVFILCFYMVQIQVLNAQSADQDSISSAKIKANTYFQQLQKFYKKGDNKTHKLYSDSLLVISIKYKFREMELKAMMNQGVYYRNISEFEKALGIYIKVIEKCKTAPSYEKIKIMAMINMGNIYNNINTPDKAIFIYKEALELIKKHKNNGFVTAAIYSGLAKANATLGNSDSSLKYNYKLKHLSDTLQNTYLKVSALSSISDLHNNNNNYKEALKTAEEALSINQTYKDSILKKDWILLNIGLAHKGLNNLNEALVYLKKSKKIAIQKKNEEVEMFCYKNLSEIYEKLDDYKKSHEAQKQYTKLKEQSLKEQKNTAILDVEHNLKTKNNIIEKQEHNISVKKKLLLYGGFILILVSGLLYFFIKKKNTIATEQKIIQKNYTLLESKYATLKESLKSLGEKNQKEIHKSEKYKNSSLTDDDRNRYMNTILEFMDKESPYLDTDITQAGLAKKLSLSTHHLSEVLTFCFEKNFYNFINIYRVNKAQELLKNRDYKNYKMESIGYESGFKSKTSFNRVFKNITGITPSDYQSNYFKE